MAPATAPNTFVFNGSQTIADLILVTEALERAGHRPSLHFVRYHDVPESVAVAFDPKEEIQAARFEVTPIGRNVLEDSAEMGVAGVDDAPDPAGLNPKLDLQLRSTLEDVRWSQVTVDTVVVWEGEQTTWGELSQNEKMECEFYADGTLVGGFRT